MDPSSEYDISLWYNEDRKQRDDRVKSTEIARQLTDYFLEKGFNVYNPEDDFLPGANFFNETKRVLDASEYLIFLLSPGFMESGWHVFTQQSTFKELLDQKKSDRFIAITILGLPCEDVPSEFNMKRIIYGDDNINHITEKLDKLLDKESHPIEETGEKLGPGAQAADDPENVAESEPKDEVVPRPDTAKINNHSGNGGNTRIKIPYPIPGRSAIQVTSGQNEIDNSDSVLLSKDSSASVHEVKINGDSDIPAACTNAEPAACENTVVTQSEEDTSGKQMIPSESGWFQPRRFISFAWSVILFPVLQRIFAIGGNVFETWLHRRFNS